MQNRQPLKTYYQMLGLQPEVSSLEIKMAYRSLVKSHHPDVEYNEQSHSQRTLATEYMMSLNEAYETLIDKSKRAAYDYLIGANGRGRPKLVFTEIDGGECREAYLRHNFNPCRMSIVRILKKYPQQLTDLSQDIYDDQLIATFEKYVDEVEDTLRKGSQMLSSKETPRTLVAAVQMMRYSIAQAADGLEELRRFCLNYDYAHLHMADNLFREAHDLARQGLQLTKSC
jgi:molecular chaperone DnaJ